MNNWSFYNLNSTRSLLIGNNAHFKSYLSNYLETLSLNSKYYQDVFAKIDLNPVENPIQFFASLPPLTKKEYGGALFKESLRKAGDSQFVMESTSGTTGQIVFRVCRKSEDLNEQEVTERCFAEIGMGPSDTFVCADLGMASIYDFYFRAARNLGVNNYYTLHCSSDFESSLSPLRKLNPTILLMVPSVMRRAWPVMKNLWPKRESPIKSFVHMGEEMNADFKNEVESTWKCKVYSFFGTTEVGGIGMSCPKNGGIHYDPYASLIALDQPTVIDENTQEGKALFTTPNLKLQSLVNYQIGDLVRISNKPCACGNPNPQMWFLRRDSDAFVFAGIKLSREQFLERGRIYIKELDTIKIKILDTSEKLVLKIYVSKKFKPWEKQLYRAWTNDIYGVCDLYLQNLVDVDVIFVESNTLSKRKDYRVVDARATTLEKSF